MKSLHDLKSWTVHRLLIATHL